MTDQDCKDLQEFRRLMALLAPQKRALVVRFACRSAAPNEKEEVTTK